MIEPLTVVAQANNASNDGLVRMIIQMMAYVVPFFLIPATFKFGLGVFGNLAGMVNDRGRGFFDKQRKKRTEVRAGNAQRMRQGERFNNRGLNAMTSRATTNRLGFTKKGQAAYQQKMALAGSEFAKTGAGQALQHNDPALRALTYGSEIEAGMNMAKDFNMYKYDAGGNITNKAEADAQVKTAVAAAKASGGFGRDRQVWATQQLVATGTGYDNQEQMTGAIARAAHGNQGQVQSLVGNMNATTKTVGRSDLAGGFDDLVKAANGDVVAARKAEFEASGSVDAVTAVRGKPAGLKNNVAVINKVLNNPGLYEADQVEAARRRARDLIINASYGPEPNQRVITEAFADNQEIGNLVRQEMRRRGGGNGPNVNIDGQIPGA